MRMIPPERRDSAPAPAGPLPARPAAVLVGLFIVVRLLVLAIGCRFDADNLTTWMQIADIALLREDLLRTLWYLHTQPPLFNLIIGLALRLGDDGFLWAMELLYAAVALGGILSFHALARDLTGKPGLALLLASWFCVSPAVLLFSQKLYYDAMVPWLLCMAFYGLHRGFARRSTGLLLFGFTMLAVTVLLRSMFHPLVFVGVAAIYCALGRGQRVRVRVLATAAVPALAIALVLLKNAMLFGVAGLSSWAPLNLDHTTVDRLPLPQRIALMHEGRLSRFAGLESFAPPSDYLAVTGPIAPTGEPSLDNLRKSTGDVNWNHIVYTRIGKERAHDAMVALEVAPGSFAKVLVTSLYHFHRPSSEFKGLERNLAVIAPWDRFANAVVGLQPAAWFGSSLDPKRPAALLLQISYAAVLVTAAFLGGVGLLAREAGTMLLRRRWPAAEWATPAALALVGLFVIAVSSSFDVWENNRARYDCGPILMLGAAWFAVWAWQWRHARVAASADRQGA